MRLFELFADPPLNLSKDLGNMIANVLAPLVASGVPHVSVDAVIDKLRQANTGIRIDRAMAIQLCDPTEMHFVKAIEGDKLVLTEPSIDRAAETEDHEAKRREKIKTGAEKQAKAELKKDNKLPDMAKKAGDGPL
jgi:hypothetical protein